MSVDPVQRFLGVEESADPRTLLGLRGAPDAVAVEAALRERVAALYRHPEGRSEDAEKVRARLREAADELLGARRAGKPDGRRRGRPPRAGGRPLLTDFDRQVLAILIGSGGWNAAARSRLVSVAGAYGVTVQGLFKVVAGLAEHARTGGGRLEVADITGGSGRRVEALPAARSAPDADQWSWAAKLAPQLREGGTASTIKLSLFFGSLALLVAVLAARLLFAPRPAPPSPSPEPVVDAGGFAARVETPAPQVAAHNAPPPGRVLEFDRRPTFQGQALTPEAATAADECAGLAEEIRLVARRLVVSDEPSSAVLRSWDVAVETIASGWALVDEHVQSDIEQAMLEALYAASDSPSVADRLLATLAPPSGRVLEPIDVWRGAWSAGMLARVRSSALPPAVVDRARIQLELAVGGAPASDFTAAATAWLDRAAAAMVDGMEFDPQAEDFWEFWIAAQRRLGRGPRHDGAIMSAIEAILAAPDDLPRQGRTVDVLGRLVELADFQSSPVVRRRLIGLFGEGSRASSRDLWILTSIVARYGAAPWFGEDLVLPQDADWIFRRRVADRIAGRWALPEAEPAGARVAGAPVDATLAGRWVAQHEARRAAPARQDVAQLDALVAAARLNEAAAALAAGDRDRAAELLAALEQGAAPRAPGAAGGPPRGLRRGEAIGRDGEWAVAYEEAGRNTQARLDLLGAMRRRAGTDLGPIDAEVFVREVYRGSPADIRAEARAVLVEQFVYGSNIAVELVDQLPVAPRSEPTTDTIQAYTGRILPNPRSDSWPGDARLALVEHALALLGGPDRAIEDRTVVLAEAYAGRIALLEPQRSASARPGTPQEAAETLADAWRRRAAGGADETGAEDLAGMTRRDATRRRLARGPIQRFVAAQLAVLDLMAWVTVAEQPALEGRARAILAASLQARAGAEGVIEQALLAERAMGDLWRLRLVGAAGGGAGGAS